MAELVTRKGEVIQIDDERHEELSRRAYFINSRGYPARTINENGKPRVVLLHREITNAPDGWDVDHINLNKLDARQCNLRVCTRSQNKQNTNSPARKEPSKSKYKGVSWDTRRQKWFASLRHFGKTFFLGRFDLEDEAAKAYNAAALKEFGEFARLNTIQEVEF